MEHIKKFKTQDEFLTEKPNLPYPCVSYIEETDTVEYKKQSYITAKYKITEGTMYAYNLLELTELPIYSNSQGALKSYSFNGETHVFEEPKYQYNFVNVEFNEKFYGYIPSKESYIYASAVTENMTFSTPDDVNFDDYYICLFYYRNGNQYFNSIEQLQTTEGGYIVISDDLKSFSLNDFAYNKLKNEYEYMFVAYREKNINTDGDVLSSEPQVKTYVTFEDGTSKEMKFIESHKFEPKFEYALNISNITTEHVFYANRTLDINNDIVGMTLHDIDGNVIQHYPFPLSFLMENDFLILKTDNKSVSLTQNFINSIQSNNSEIYISLFFAEYSDFNENSYLIKTPTIKTINYEETLTNSDASLFNGKINIQLSDIEIDKEYELKLVLNDSAKSIGVYAPSEMFDKEELLKRIEKIQDQNDVLIASFLLNSALTKIDLTKIDKEKEYVIPSDSFMVCVGLEEVIMNHSISTISDYAFALCTNLKKINIPNTVTLIGESSFNGCQSLENIKLPDSVQFIYDSAFSACTSLTSVTFGKNVMEIGSKAFEYCCQLNEIIFTSYNMPNIYSHIQQSGGDGGIQNNTFFDISYRGTVYYPLDSKGYYVLDSDFTLKNWSKQLIIKGNEIPDMVVTYNVTDTNISTKLHNSSQIKMMRINGNNVDYTQSYIFENVGEYTVEYFTHRPNAINLNNCNRVSSVIIGENITLIGEKAFYNCSGLTSVTIGSGVTSIGTSAFGICSNLTSIEIPDSVTSIGEYAFAYCSGLTSVTIPNSVNSIGSYAFSNCSGLTSIACNAVTAPTIGSNTFSNIAGNGTLYYPQGSDYSSWMNTEQYYLGYYNWASQEIEVPTEETTE